MGEATLLDNEQARQLKSLIDNGIKLSVSSRSLGSVKNGIVEDFKLITYDVVDTPSDYNATMNGLVESYQLNEGILMDKEFDIVDDKIVEVQSLKKSKGKKSIKEEDTEDKKDDKDVEILNDDDDSENSKKSDKNDDDKKECDKDDKDDKDEKSEITEQDLNRFNQELKNKFKELLSSF